MSILERLQDPAELRGLSEAELVQLAAEIRETIVRTVAATGGHLGSSLGVVEVTLALHRLLESPRDKIVWDTGHQAYAHKLLTGRLDRFHTLRQIDGLGGFPRRSESPHDVMDGGHAGHRPVHRPGPRHRPRPASLDGADRGRGGRRGPPVGALAGGPQRHRPPADAAADRPQRQRDVDQPVRGRAVQVPLGDQAVAGLAAGQGSLGHGDGERAGGGSTPGGAEPPDPAVRRLVRAARPAVRGPGDHLRRRHARARPPVPRGDVPSRARAQGACDRPRPDPEGEGLQARRDGPGQLPRRRAAAHHGCARDRWSRPHRRHERRRREHDRIGRRWLVLDRVT